MEEVTLRLTRENLSRPWGFRMQGGADIGFPLTVQRVFSGSPAEGVLHRGDIILRIDSYDITNVLHREAQDLVRIAANDLTLLVKRPFGSGGLSTPRQTDNFVPEPPDTSVWGSSAGSHPRASLTPSRPAVNGFGDHRSPRSDEPHFFPGAERKSQFQVMEPKRSTMSLPRQRNFGNQGSGSVWTTPPARQNSWDPQTPAQSSWQQSKSSVTMGPTQMTRTTQQWNRNNMSTSFTQSSSSTATVRVDPQQIRRFSANPSFQGNYGSLPHPSRSSTNSNTFVYPGGSSHSGTTMIHNYRPLEIHSPKFHPAYPAHMKVPRPVNAMQYSTESNHMHDQHHHHHPHNHPHHHHHHHPEPQMTNRRSRAISMQPESSYASWTPRNNNTINLNNPSSFHAPQPSAAPQWSNPPMHHHHNAPQHQPQRTVFQPLKISTTSTVIPSGSIPRIRGSSMPPQMLTGPSSGGWGGQSPMGGFQDNKIPMSYVPPPSDAPFDWTKSELAQLVQMEDNRSRGHHNHSVSFSNHQQSVSFQPSRGGIIKGATQDSWNRAKMAHAGHNCEDDAAGVSEF